MSAIFLRLGLYAIDAWLTVYRDSSQDPDNAVRKVLNFQQKKKLKNN